MNVANVEVLPIPMLPVPNLSDAVLAYANWKLAARAILNIAPKPSMMECAKTARAGMSFRWSRRSSDLKFFHAGRSSIFMAMGLKRNFLPHFEHFVRPNA